MKALWYGDRRDRVKWGALVHLTRSQRIPHIVQVAYFRDCARPTLETSEGAVDLPLEVWNHFSDLKHIKRLERLPRPGKDAGLSITVLDDKFDPKCRRAYIDGVIAKIAAVEPPRVVFLDPDTGLGEAPEHVTMNDAATVWAHMRAGDLLVVYQHADRTRTWRDNRMAQLARACSGVQVHAITSPVVSKDVAMLWCRKK